MDKETPENPVPDREHVKEGAGQSQDKKSDAEDTSVAKAPPGVSDLKEKSTSGTQEEISGETLTAAVEPPADWFEPLEDDDEANSDRNDPEEESLAGESERSEGGEKALKRINRQHAPRRKRTHPDEGWLEWPELGEGWKRKEVVRRSGSSIGQKDVYYVSPKGERVRSRVELVSVVQGQLDLSTFEYKTGKFLKGEAQPIRVRHRVKKKVRERSSSESSWMDRGEGADTPDSHHRLTPNLGPKHTYSTHNQTNVSSQSMTAMPYMAPKVEHSPPEEKIRLPPPSSKPTLVPSVNGKLGIEDSILVCSRCGISFTGTWYDKQRKRPCCPSCWASSKTKEHPLIRFRKWIPCGQCVGCRNTINCGQCANCKHGMQSPESRKRLCRKRKCICPIRKSPGSVGGTFLSQSFFTELPETYDDNVSLQSESTDSQNLGLKNSDTENFSVNVDVDDEDDMSTDDDDDWHKKRKRRSCGECKACLHRKDCGTCDFCIDKPKFGGSNKKRQKCRLRQCQRQAMRHLLPFQMGQAEFAAEGTVLPGRPRPHYTYSRKPGVKKTKGPQGYDLSDDDDDSNHPPMSWSSEPAGGSKNPYELNVNMRNNHSTLQASYADTRQRNGLTDRVPNFSNHNNSEAAPQGRWNTEEPLAGRHGSRQVEEDDYDEDDEDDDEEEFPMITQIFSLADNPARSGVDSESRLMKLLYSLRTSALPILWYAIMVEGPQIQLIQCSKQSIMADTVVLIDPDFCFQVTVQRQPLLPTHSLYDTYPGRLTSVTEVVNLLLGLDQYAVCHGLPPKEPIHKDIIILERASTCDFLVRKNVRICDSCRALRGL
ncbi:methyl-CpG-binding domain protein 1b isoform X2 [Halichoeres trimaculatus]|uniref:methyl-CpG-binding domain protein 1b isoform X2 n=1 Tax=Halichoeres trimaculatus TaxID=147232 RepID=UPI003D9EB8D9